jgi:hypothetical protein
MRLKIVLAFLPVLLSVAGCNIYACKYETRFVSVRGNAASPQVGSVNVESMGFRQYNPEQPVSNSVSYVARGEGMTAAPTRLTLRDSRDLLRVVAELSMQTSPTSFAAASAFDVASSDRDRMFELLASGNARLILDLANDASLTVPLTVATREDWHRPSCD